MNCSEADVANELRRIGVATPAAFEMVAELLGTFRSQIDTHIESLAKKGAIHDGRVDAHVMASLGASGRIDSTPYWVKERLDISENYSDRSIPVSPIRRKATVSMEGAVRRKGV